MPRTRPIIRFPRSTADLEAAKIASVIRNGVYPGRGTRQRQGRINDTLAGTRTSGGGRISGGTFTAPAS